MLGAMNRAACVLLLVLCACGAATSPIVGLDGGGSTRDAGAPSRDAGRADSGARLDAGTRPEGLVFRLSFRSDVGGADSIFAQQSTSSREGPGWLSVRTAAGSSLAIVGRCDLCDCPTAGGRCVGCPVCGPPPDFVVQLFGTGDLVEHRWDGLVHDTATCDSGELALCSAPPTAAPPGDYVATFCWSTVATGVGMGAMVGMSTCDDVTFHLPDDDGVVEDPVCFCG